MFPRSTKTQVHGFVLACLFTSLQLLQQLLMRSRQKTVIFRGFFSVETIPDAGKKGLLSAKFYLGPLFVVGATKRLPVLADFRWTIAASHHVIVKDAESLGSVRQGVDSRRKDSPQQVFPKAMAAHQTRKTPR
jgi:hypothetical protein